MRGGARGSSHGESGREPGSARDRTPRRPTGLAGAVRRAALTGAHSPPVGRAGPSGGGSTPAAPGHRRVVGLPPSPPAAPTAPVGRAGARQPWRSLALTLHEGPLPRVREPMPSRLIFAMSWSILASSESSRSMLATARFRSRRPAGRSRASAAGPRGTRTRPRQMDRVRHPGPRRLAARSGRRSVLRDQDRREDPELERDHDEENHRTRPHRRGGDDHRHHRARGTERGARQPMRGARARWTAHRARGR